MEKMLAILVMILAILTMSACAGAAAETVATAATKITVSSAPTTIATQKTTATEYVPVDIDYDDEDLDDSWSASGSTVVTLEGDSISVNGKGAAVQGSRVAITAGGTYIVYGTLDDGQVFVESLDKEAVRIVLNGADITCLTSAPLYIMEAEKVVIILAESTNNYLTDGSSYVLADEATDEPDAALFSKSDLTINGDGSLTVEGNYNNGIQSKDDLVITGGTITVTAVNDGLKGKDMVALTGAVIAINTGGDGIVSNNDDDPGKGFIVVDGGELDITAMQDGIEAATNVLISSGVICITTGGGSGNSSTSGGNWGIWGNHRSGTAVETGDTTSAKGIKAAVNVTIEGGVIDIDSSDDSVHSNDSVTISGGTITASSGDDGIHADATLEINDGVITLAKSYEGLESAVITINGGDLDITSSDDGINVAGGNDASSLGGRPGQNMFQSSGNNYLYINGGYIVVDAGGDGLDTNGSFSLTGGIVIVNGPTNNGNGPLDYMGTFQITGGFIAAAGSSGMAQAASQSSTQGSVLVVFSQAQNAGTLVHIESENGEDILTFAPSKTFQSILVSSSELQTGETYTVYLGGSSSGSSTDGVYDGGTCSGGSEYADFTLTGTVTTVGWAGGGMMNPGMQGGGRR